MWSRKTICMDIQRCFHAHAIHDKPNQNHVSSWDLLPYVLYFLLTDQHIPQQVKTSAKRSQKMSKDVYIKKYILHYLIMYINIIEDINE